MDRDDKNLGRQSTMALGARETTSIPSDGASRGGLDRQAQAFGRSTDFIITAEAYEGLAETDPERARFQIILRLYDTCYPRVYSFLRRSVSPDVADDLAQETFLRLLSHKNIERMSISISYLFRVAQNLLRRRYNDLARRRAALDGGYKHEQSRNPVQQTSGSRTVSIDSEQLGHAIQHLSPREHDVLRLIVCEGLSYAEAARVLGVPISTVNNWKYRALTRLRDFIEVGVDPDVQHRTPCSPGRIDLGRDPSRGARQQVAGSGAFVPVDQSAGRSEGSAGPDRLVARAAG